MANELGFINGGPKAFPHTMREGFVGVHIGAGQHSELRTQLYLDICSRACQKGVEVLKSGGSALDAACAATMVLEDSGDTNAGYGSNLTESGTVEMDAGIMDGSSLLFGAVGAMPGIKNPILVAKLLVREQQKGLLPLGRVPPGFLVGEGARNWAVRHGVPSVDAESLVSDKANKLYRHYKKKLDTFRMQMQQHLKRKTGASTATPTTVAPAHAHAALAPQLNNQATNGAGLPTAAAAANGSAAALAMASKSNGETPAAVDSSCGERVPKVPRHSLDDAVTDTVGVVVMDSSGNVASTVSSGGIALKQPGRVGQASCFGCGCWAQRAKAAGPNYSVGISTTGCGEHLVRTFLARECATELNKSPCPMDALQKVMKEKFAESEFLAGVPEKLGGAICMHYDEEMGRGEFLWTHTTSSMGIAFQTTADAAATAKMSRLPAMAVAAAAAGGRQNGGEAVGTTSILVESMPFSTIPPPPHPNRIVEPLMLQPQQQQQPGATAAAATALAVGDGGGGVPPDQEGVCRITVGGGSTAARA